MIEGSRQLRVALAHDWLVGLRGGERVLDRLARLFGPTVIYTLVNDRRPLTEAIDACRVVTSPLQRLPGAAGSVRRSLLPLMPWAVRRLRVEPCDLLISSSSGFIKSIAAPLGVSHLCFCHSPARYLWEQSADYGHGRGGMLRRAGLATAGGALRRWDRRTAAGVTAFIASSAHTARRIERCWGRVATVIHPPVRTGYFTVNEAVGREPWLLIVSALEPYKRVDLAIDAANAARLPLKVVGRGSQEPALRRLAGSTVELLGHVDDGTLRDLYRRSRALLHPQVEDFGIIAVEAQATGCPVIALRAGGAVETVEPDAGVFFEEQTSAALVCAVRELEQREIDPAACRRSAERFGEERFDAAIMREVERVLNATGAGQSHAHEGAGRG